MPVASERNGQVDRSVDTHHAGHKEEDTHPRAG